MVEHLFSLGVLKAGAKAINHITGGGFCAPVEVLEEITHSPGYTKMRIDNAQDKLSEIWDEHKENVSDFFEKAGDSITDGLESAGEFLSDGLENIGEIIGNLFG